MNDKQQGAFYTGAPSLCYLPMVMTEMKIKQNVLCVFAVAVCALMIAPTSCSESPRKADQEVSSDHDTVQKAPKVACLDNYLATGKTSWLDSLVQLYNADLQERDEYNLERQLLELEMGKIMEVAKDYDGAHHMYTQVYERVNEMAEHPKKYLSREYDFAHKDITAEQVAKLEKSYNEALDYLTSFCRIYLKTATEADFEQLRNYSGAVLAIPFGELKQRSDLFVAYY